MFYSKIFFRLSEKISLFFFLQTFLSIVSLYSVFNVPLSVLHSKLNNIDASFLLLRKEVIHPHVPVGIPCYDFTPIIDPTFDSSLLTVRPPASGVINSHGVTGGVYKARERIHRNMADLRLLAIPASCSRVADCNPDYDRVFEVRSTSLSRCSLSLPL